MINPEDLRIGDIVQTNKDCMFPKDTLCIVTDIHPERLYNAEKFQQLKLDFGEF